MEKVRLREMDTEEEKKKRREEARRSVESAEDALRWEGSLRTRIMSLVVGTQRPLRVSPLCIAVFPRSLAKHPL